MYKQGKKFWRQIILFNRPAFIAAGIVLIICLLLLFVFHLPFNIRLLLALVIAGTAWFSIGSVFFSYIIYDGSDLYTFNWLKTYLPQDKILFNIYSGYSEGGHILNDIFKNNSILHFDFFDKTVSVTASIKKAQQLSIPLKNIHSDVNDLGTDKKADAILFMQSLHELRAKELKTVFLRECARHLNPGGRIIIAEHICNLPNFLVYGPGAFHFFGERHWADTIRSAGLSAEITFHITPFVKIFILSNDRS